MIFNGKKIENDANFFGIQNRAFQYGDGIFETLRFEGGQFYLTKLHYKRLTKSCQMVNLSNPFKDFANFEALLEKIAEKKTPFARCKVFVWRKEGGYFAPDTNLADYCIYFQPCKKPKVNAQKLTVFRQFYVPCGVEGNIKSLSALCYVQAAIYAKNNGFHQALITNTNGEFIETEKANIFFGLNGKVYTPPLSSGCLNGIMRQQTLVFLNRQKVKVHYKTLTEDSIKKIDWLFLTNAIAVWQPVKAIDDKQLNLWEHFQEFREKVNQYSRHSPIDI